MKSNNIRRVILILILGIFIMILTSCSKNTTSDLTLVATVSDNYQLSINENEAVVVTGETKQAEYYKKLKNAKSVSAGLFNGAVILESGKVYISSSQITGEFFTEDWEDIEVVKFTLFHAFGLKNDGTIVGANCEKVDAKWEDRASEVQSWKDIVYIDSTYFLLAGIDDRGSVHIETFGIEKNDFIKQAEEWENISKISMSDDIIVGITSNGELLIATNENKGHIFNQETVSTLKDAQKIIVGKVFIAGLMSDGTVKVEYPIYNTNKSSIDFSNSSIFDDIINNINFYSEEIIYAETVYSSLEDLEGVVDINCYKGFVSVLLDDGTVFCIGNDYDY